jgi:hypothetical protein
VDPPEIRDPDPLPEGVTDDPATWPGQVRQDHLPVNQRFSPDEYAIAQRLAQSGPVDIEPIPRGPDRTADALVDGEPTEFKTVYADPPSNRTIKQQLSGSGAGITQGGNIIIDARNTTLTRGQAIKGIAAYLNAAPENLAKVSRIRIWGADFDLDWRRTG